MRGKLAYIPALDGLRALAVLAVVAYHAGAPIPAGFVGVDVFFVISGYLITRLLHDELQRTDRISFVDFYARRARRILPALTAVVVVTLAASIALLSREGVAETEKAAAAAFLFAANVFFANAPSGYFDAAPQDNPLLHLWSIGVEEQFYLVWPVVLILARKRSALALAGIGAVSFAVCEWMLWTGHGQAAFYQAPARAWELAAGGLIALAPPMIFPRWTGWAALALVLASCAATFEHFPGAGALPAVVGASLLIATLHNGRGCAPLESRPLVWIGLISYSLYLWHWPVLVLGQGLPIAAQVSLALAVAALSYYFVETPFRKRFVFSARRSVTAAFLVVAAGAASAITLQPLQLGRQTIPPANVPSIYTMHCDDWYESAQVKPCKFGLDTAQHKAVIIGDSVAMQWFPAVYKIFDRPDWQLIVLTKSSCPMAEVSYYLERIHRTFRECDEWRPNAIALIARLNPDVVLIGSANNYGFTESQWTEGTRSVLEEMSKIASEVKLLRSTPLLIPGSSNAFADVAAWERNAARELANVSIIDMNDVVCPVGACKRSAALGQVFRDDRHIQWDFAATLSPELKQRLQIKALK